MPIEVKYVCMLLTSYRAHIKLQVSGNQVTGKGIKVLCTILLQNRIIVPPNLLFFLFLTEKKKIA